VAIDDGWMVKAACRNYDDPDPIFFPPTTKGVAPDYTEAKRICFDECPVRKTCLVYAVAHHETRGVWGGLSDVERKAIPRLIKHQYTETWFRLHPYAKRRAIYGGR
jgi:WhiB family transcriptional regulator, redox-sensing transcriptional regulator